MKKLSIILGILLLTSFQVVTAKPAPVKATHKHKKIDGAPLLFWTSNRSYGPIQIYVNDVYQGDITAAYNSTPECAAQGCVTVIINGDNNVWTAKLKMAHINGQVKG